MIETSSEPILRIEAMFQRHGQRSYSGSREEPVTALQHALQCAQLAEWAHADAVLVAAALLHDIGHFEIDTALGESVDDQHELRALPWLSQVFTPEVVEPIRLHVAAKRYLVATDATYATTLSPASVHSLALQGGPMSAAEAQAFEGNRYAADAVLLRRWDDAAKVPGKVTPPLAYYMAVLEELLERPFADSKLGIGSTTV